MKLARLGEVGEEIPVLLADEAVFDLRPVIGDIDGTALTAAGLGRIREAARQGRLPRLVDARDMRVGSPIARPGAVVCIGLNYAAHAAETGVEKPTAPIVFFKHPSSVCGPDDEVSIPRGSTRTDWEAELGVVIGRTAHDLDGPADARGYIAGYLVANDVSERAYQIELSGGQWSKGKSAPGFCPLGPWLVTADELEPDDLRIRSWVNGEPRQDSTTADLIFGVDHLVWDLSRYMVLEPGDVILTGTPQGVALSGAFPYLAGGDVVTVEIEGLGRQVQRFRASG